MKSRSKKPKIFFFLSKVSVWQNSISAAEKPGPLNLIILFLFFSENENCDAFFFFCRILQLSRECLGFLFCNYMATSQLFSWLINLQVIHLINRYLSDVANKPKVMSSDSSLNSTITRGTERYWVYDHIWRRKATLEPAVAFLLEELIFCQGN